MGHHEGVMGGRIFEHSLPLFLNTPRPPVARNIIFERSRLAENPHVLPIFLTKSNLILALRTMVLLLYLMCLYIGSYQGVVPGVPLWLSKCPCDVFSQGQSYLDVLLSLCF